MTKPCPICGEQHDADRTLSYDGHGINSCGLYRERLATFEPRTPEHLRRVAAAAPEMLAMLKAITYAFYVKGTRKELQKALEGSRELIRKAEGRT